MWLQLTAVGCCLVVRSFVRLLFFFFFSIFCFFVAFWTAFSVRVRLCSMPLCRFYESSAERWCHLLCQCDNNFSNTRMKNALRRKWLADTYTVARTHIALYWESSHLHRCSISSSAHKRIKMDYGFCFDLLVIFFFRYVYFCVMFLLRPPHWWQRLSKNAFEFLFASLPSSKRKRLIWIYCYSVNCF